MLAIGTKIIETDRLLLRKIELSDSDKIYKNWTKERYYEL